MAANTTPDNIVYPTLGDDVGELEVVFGALATSVQNAFTTRFGSASVQKVPALAVNTVAERNAIYPSPIQGNRVWRNDKGWEEAYFGLYNATSNPAGTSAAGWYPIAGAMPFGRMVRSSQAFVIPSSAYTDISSTAYWTTDRAVNVSPFANGWTVPVDGIYNLTATIAANGGTSMLAGFLLSGATPNTPAMMEGGTTSGNLQGWTMPICSMTKKLTAGQVIKFWALSGTSASTWNTDSRGSSWSIQYVSPPVGA